jgi:hypothetical protein
MTTITIAMPICRFAVLGASLFAAAILPAMAQDAGDDGKTAYKLTGSWYRQDDGTRAIDLNLRANQGPHAAWLGLYRDNMDFQQLRSGYEYTQEQGPLRVVWSAQAASYGFLGGSVTAQYGENIYPILAFGRTNLRPYVNLNFDPNDMATIGIGTKSIARTELNLTHVWDNRLETGQHVTHLYLHRDLDSGRRASLDIAYKHGTTSDGGYAAGYALTGTYTLGKYFVRGAWDQYANFGSATQVRLSFGMSI